VEVDFAAIGGFESFGLFFYLASDDVDVGGGCLDNFSTLIKREMLIIADQVSPLQLLAV